MSPRFLTSVILAAALATASAAPSAAPIPRLGDHPGVVVLANDAELSFAWTLEDDGTWLKPYDGDDPLLRKFQTTIAARLPANWQALLRRQRALFRKHGRGTALIDWVLAHPRQVRPMNRMQAMLFLTHWRDEKPLKREFQAFVLRRNGLWRVYYTQSDERSAWPHSPQVKALLAKDLQAGWTLFAHVHNHPFFFDNPTGDIAGTTVPSPADVALYRELAVTARLRRAWIVNGFDALELTAADLPRLPVGEGAGGGDGGGGDGGRVGNGGP